MTSRKRKITLIQILLFFLASTLMYFFYFSSSEKVNNEKLILKPEEKKSEDENNLNLFSDVEYSGMDLNGNRFKLKSKEARFDNSFPELIELQNLILNLYLKNGNVIVINADKGSYNNKTFDMMFKNNIKSVYLSTYLYSDFLDYMNTEGMLEVYGNVNGKGPSGDIEAEKLIFNLTKETLDISAYDSNKVKIDLKKNEKRF